MLGSLNVKASYPNYTENQITGSLHQELYNEFYRAWENSPDQIQVLAASVLSSDLENKQAQMIEKVVKDQYFNTTWSIHPFLHLFWVSLALPDFSQLTREKALQALGQSKQVNNSIINQVLLSLFLQPNIVIQRTILEIWKKWKHSDINTQWALIYVLEDKNWVVRTDNVLILRLDIVRFLENINMDYAVYQHLQKITQSEMNIQVQKAMRQTLGRFKIHHAGYSPHLSLETKSDSASPITNSKGKTVCSSFFNWVKNRTKLL